MAQLFKTAGDYPNATGINKVLYSLRDAIPFFNPFAAILFIVMLTLTSGFYYAFVNMSGKERFFNALLASNFITFMASVFLVAGDYVSPYVALTFIGTTVMAWLAVTFYR